MVRRWTPLVWSAALPALVSSLAGGGPAAAEPVTPAVLERLRAATVFICVYEPRSDRARASGTGFLVSPRGEIAAPLHLISGSGPLQVILNSGQPGERRVNAAVVEVDRASDLALLKVELAQTPYLEIGDSARMRETNAVTSVGFPLGVELKTGELGPAPSFRTGTITSVRRTRYGGVVWLEVSGGAEPGSSGSPVVDENGLLVGVVLERHGTGTVLARPSAPTDTTPTPARAMGSP